MPVRIVAERRPGDPEPCTKYLSRAGDPSASAEAWRFPVIDVFRGSRWTSRPRQRGHLRLQGLAGHTAQVAVLGTFGRLYEAIPLRPVKYPGRGHRLFRPLGG